MKTMLTLYVEPKVIELLNQAVEIVKANPRLKRKIVGSKSRISRGDIIKYVLEYWWREEGSKPIRPLHV